MSGEVEADSRSVLYCVGGPYDRWGATIAQTQAVFTPGYFCNRQKWRETAGVARHLCSGQAFILDRMSVLRVGKTPSLSPSYTHAPGRLDRFLKDRRHASQDDVISKQKLWGNDRVMWTRTYPSYRALNIPVFGFGVSSYHLSAEHRSSRNNLMMDVGYSDRCLHEGQSQGDYGFLRALSTHTSLTDGQVVRGKVVWAEGAGVPVTLPSGDYGFLSTQMSDMYMYRRTGGQGESGVPVTLPSGDYSFLSTHMSLTDGQAKSGESGGAGGQAKIGVRWTVDRVGSRGNGGNGRVDRWSGEEWQRRRAKAAPTKEPGGDYAYPSFTPLDSFQQEHKRRFEFLSSCPILKGQWLLSCVLTAQQPSPLKHDNERTCRTGTSEWDKLQDIQGIGRLTFHAVLAVLSAFPRSVIHGWTDGVNGFHGDQTTR
ncbi:hypothetical protein Bbelb_321350 [Branchiostoma belcheri]|nr:hypothetical protein Bbelb_321350 [Branchiostoma belcheri]